MQWLVDLDDTEYSKVRTPFALERWNLQGLAGAKQFAFNPERGTGQGDIRSPFTWLAVFDVLLTMLKNTPPHVWPPLSPAAPRRLLLRGVGYLLCCG